uniref:Ovule protein n=1 Tax=Brugia timori TaxID=42155 RepID=A0A0R3Q432_9BILA
LIVYLLLIDSLFSCYCALSLYLHAMQYRHSRILHSIYKLSS